MEKLRDVSGLQVSQDLEFERRTFRFERVAWTVVTIVLAATALGLLGGIGPLTASSRSPAEGGLEVGYARFVRLGSPVQLDVELDGGRGQARARGRARLARQVPDRRIPARAGLRHRDAGPIRLHL